MLPAQLMFSAPIPRLPLAFTMFPYASLLIMAMAVVGLLAVVRTAFVADRYVRRIERESAPVRALPRRVPSRPGPSDGQPLAA
jgi:hypothetical protein